MTPDQMGNHGADWRKLVVFFLLAFGCSGFCQSPNVDSFNPGAQDKVYSFAVQADGKILVGGSFSFLGGQHRSSVGRLNEDGTVDLYFNPSAGSSSSSHSVNSLAIQTDGKIWIGGYFFNLAGQNRSYLGRLKDDGSLDTGFNPEASDSVYCFASQADGKILVGGAFTNLGGQVRSYLGRLNVDGSVDTNFNLEASGSVVCLAVQGDGKILVGGAFTTLGGLSRTNIGRLNSDGTMDTNFNPQANGTVKCLALQADDKILAGGVFDAMGGQSRTNIGRLNPDGTLDINFNPGAQSGLSYIYDEVNSLAVQADGKILVGGLFSLLGGQSHTNIGRLNKDGSADTNFHCTANSYVYSIALQKSGKILVGGDFTTLGDQNRSHFGRLNNTEIASESLAWNVDTMTWLRGGSSPEIWRTTFETWNGTEWTSLGTGIRILGGWELNGVALSSNVTVRARGYVTGGQYNGSTWFVETGAGPLIIASQPVSRTNNALTAVSFSSSAVGESPMTYKWYKNGAPLTDDAQVSGTTTPVLSLTNVLGGNMGDYLIVISNTFGSVTSLVATLTVIDPRITGQPVHQYKTVGANATFSVTALGTQPLNYQWSKEGAALNNATNSILTMTNLQGTDAGNYDAVVSNSYGSVTSTVAMLSINLATVDTDFNPGANGPVFAFALQTDGEILVGGSFSALGGQNRNNFGQLNPNGTVDTNFSLGANNQVLCFAVQSDGKVLLGGKFTTLGGQNRGLIGRLNSSGTVDSGFNPGTGGGSFTPSVYCMALQPDGKILVGGSFFTLGGQSRTNIARLNPNGTLDTNFNPTAIGGSLPGVYSLAMQTDGKILVGGNFTNLAGASRTNIARLNSDGTLDTNFSPVSASFNSGYSGGVSCLVVQPDGKILLGGNFYFINGQSRASIGRLNSDGRLDMGFNPNAPGGITSLALQTDGKILACGGFTSIGGKQRAYIGRINEDGSVDATFNSSVGYYTTYAVAVQTDGKILVGGALNILGGITRTNIGRLNGTGAVDQSVTSDGSTITWLREGGGPEIWRANFEAWNGASWTNLGSATRISGGWRLNGLAISSNAIVRARGYASGGQYGGSTWLVETMSGQAEIIGQPASRTNNALTTATFSVNVIGANSTYQWFKDGVALTNGGQISGATASTLILSNVLGDNMGNYFIVVSNSFGTVTSAVAILKVKDPFIVTQPFTQTHYASNYATFSVSVAASSPLNYQWRKDGVPLTDGGIVLGASTPTLTLAGVFGPDKGGYSVIISNSFGNVTSSVATLSVRDPYISYQPIHQSTSVGSNAIFSVTAVGTTPIIYQWRKEGVALNGATDSVLALTNVQGTQAGKYDLVVRNNFGSDTSGIVLLNVNLAFPEDFNLAANSSINSFAAQTDGRVLIGGNFDMLGVINTSIGRLNTNGAADIGFNPMVSGLSRSVRCIAVQKDGKILVGGSFTSLAGQSRTHLGRLNSDGTLDTSFNPGPNNEVYSLCLQADGKILVGGYFRTIGSHSCTNIARINADGTVDPDFDARTSSTSSFIGALATQPDGKILVGGFFTTLNGTNRSSIGRLHPNGSLDTSFDPGANNNVYCFVLQSDGKILVGGKFNLIGGSFRDGIARLHTNGSLDTSFNPNVSAFGEVRSLALQADGKILVGGSFTTLGGQNRSYIGRLNSNGSIDTSFDPGASSDIDFINSVALQADGKILIGGSFRRLAGQSRANIARLHNTALASESLALNGDTLTWLRGGTAPEVTHTTFEIWNGATWTDLGVGTRVGGGWQLNGITIPSGTLVRARGLVTGGIYNGSSWFVESSGTLFSPPRFNLLAGSFSLSGFSSRIDNLSGQGPLVIYASTNFVDWLPVFTNPAGPTEFNFFDPNATNFLQRFYHAVEER